MKQFSNNLTVFLSCLAFFVLTTVFILNPSEINIVKNGAGAAISKINLLAAPIVPCGLKPGPGIPTSYTKPCSICHLYILTGNLINFVIYNIAIPLAALMFLVAGVYLIFSGGSEERIKTGRTIFQNTVIALLIVFCSWIFLNTLFQYLVNPKEFGWLETSWWKPFGECK
ncbi:MAG: hypothetical protein AAB851_03500 [Patescibacteria group bacterium]